MDIRFISNNRYKISEATAILGEAGINVIPISEKIEEIQTDDVIHLVKDKALKAFKKIGRPLFIEHTGLYIDRINQLPGGLTQVFWDKLEADNFSNLLGGEIGESKAKAITVIGYVDGKKIHLFKGETIGSIISSPKGNRDFQWDCIFVPEGEEETFAEMGIRKNDISMRKKALEEFVLFLRNAKK